MSVLIYAAGAGDRNERGMRGAISLGHALADSFDVEAQIVGAPVPVIAGGWFEQLNAAKPHLRLLAKEFGRRLDAGDAITLIMGRCAAGIATLPLIAKRYPDVAIIWFDAHGDCNVPRGKADAYLGGMVITGAAGEWDTGLGDGVDLGNMILVGARDLDPPEQERIDCEQIKLVPVGNDLGQRLSIAIGGRSVYIHLDCDVLDAGLIATEYQSQNGLSFDDLHEAFAVLAQHTVVGLEIAEYEDCWPDGAANHPNDLLAAIRPVVAVLD